MPTKSPSRGPAKPSTPDLPAPEIFRLLTDERRRNILYYFAANTDSVPLADIAEQLAIGENNPTTDHQEHILTCLHHIHLPKLVEAGMIDFNGEEKTVTGLTTIDAIRPYLDLALRDEYR